MKKFYGVFLCLILSYVGNTQTYYWIGPSGGAGGNWNDNANWSLSSGGAAVGLGVFPNGVGQSVVFDQAALVRVNVETINLSTLTVTNSRTVKLFVGTGSTAPNIILNSTSAVTQALNIGTGSRLEDSCDANIPFTVTFANDAKATVNGTWYFAGASGVTGANGATIILPSTSGLSNRIDINGTLQFRDNTLSFNSTLGQDYVFFNSGSTYWHDRNGGNTPRATWNTNATLRLSNFTSTIPTVNVGSVPELGNMVVDCATLSIATASLALPNNLVVKGNLQVTNTNNRTLILATNGTGATPITATYTVNGNFTVSGTSRVALANASTVQKAVDFQVDGNVNLGGTSFDIQLSNNVATNTSIFRIRGNLSHTAGTFGSLGSITSTTTDLYILEMNGTSAQTITSTGTINNLTDEITLRINNAAGVTLNSPLTVGKISFNSASGGILNTSSVNFLTINNTGTHSLVVNGASASGFVRGRVRRRTESSGAYTFPTGKGSIYEPCVIRPSSASISVYEAEYFNTAYSDLSTIFPLSGVSNQEHWFINTVSGVSGFVELTLNSSLAGATGTDGIVVAGYVGSDWINNSGNGTTGGAVISPGTSSSGIARSQDISISGFYTFGYGMLGTLPVKLIRFEGRKLNASSSELNWVISAGSNAASFELLRSSDASRYSSVGVVSATDRLYTYNYTDNTLPTGISYYRLRITDKDGIVTLSPVVVIQNGVNKTLLTSLVPTIVSGSATLNINAAEPGRLALTVTDLYGRVIQQHNVQVREGNQQLQFNFSNLPAGTYQITGWMNQQKTGSIRFIRQ